MLRTMKGTFSRFIAIAAIVALGVGLLSGLMAMPIDMRTTIDEYFDRQNMHLTAASSAAGPDRTMTWQPSPPWTASTR